MRRVGIYARQDPTTPAPKRRLDTQIATVAAFVQRRGGRHVATYADLSPRLTLDRPGLVSNASPTPAPGWFDQVVPGQTS